MKFKYAINTGSYEDKSPLEIAKLCEDTPIEGVEWSLPELDKAKAFLDDVSLVSNDYTLEIVGCTCPAQLWKTEEVKEYSELLANIGGKMLRVNPPWFAFNFEESIHQNSSLKDLYNLCRNGLENLVSISREYKIKYVMETHMGSMCASAESAVRLLKDLPEECFGIIFDPANGVSEGFLRPCYSVELLGLYLANVHAKNLSIFPLEKVNNFNVTREQWGMKICDLNEGYIDWVEVCFALKKANYNGWITFESIFTDSFKEKCRRAVELMNDCLINVPSEPQRPYLTLND